MAAEAELGALFLNAQEAKVLRLVREELGHPQPPTPIHVDNTTTVGIVNNTIKRQRSRAMKMHYMWLLDGDVQQIFRFYYQPAGQENLGDYPSKHHSGDVHQHVRPYYVHMNNSPTVLPRAAKPSSWRGCAETLADPAYKGKIPLPRVNSFQEPFASRQIIQQKSPNTWSGKANQYLEPSPETHAGYTRFLPSLQNSLINS